MNPAAAAPMGAGGGGVGGGGVGGLYAPQTPMAASLGATYNELVKQSAGSSHRQACEMLSSYSYS